MTDKKDKLFSRDFEDKIPAAILIDTVWAAQIFEVMNEELFDQIHTRKIVEILKKHYADYDTVPSISLLETICKREIADEVLSKKCLDYITKIKLNPLNGDIEYVKDKALEYFRVQTLGRALSDEVLPRIESGKNLEDIINIIQTAISKGTNRDIGYDYTDDEEERFKQIHEKKVPTRWKLLNEIFQGGIGEKRLLTVVGPQGGGKSSLMINFACGALMAKKDDGGGRTVVHYTLELSEHEVALKYDASLSGVAINSIIGNKESVLYKIKQKLPPGSKLFIKEYPMKQASIQTIKSHLQRLKLKNVIPDLIIVDYGDLLRGPDVGKNQPKRDGLEAIWQDLKSLAQQTKIPIITASQANRSGYNAEVILPDQIAEDISKVSTTDILLTMARNPEQKLSGQGKMYLGKNRQGRDGLILNYTINTDTCFIDITNICEENQEDKQDNKVEDIQIKLNNFLKRTK